MNLVKEFFRLYNPIQQYLKIVLLSFEMRTSRRDLLKFLGVSGAGFLFGGCPISLDNLKYFSEHRDEIQGLIEQRKHDAQKKRNVKIIYEELPKHVYGFRVEGEINVTARFVEGPMRGEKYSQTSSIDEVGRGIFLNNRFITTYHTINLFINSLELDGEYPTPLGKIKVIDRKENSKKISIGGSPLLEVYSDSKRDVVVFDVPRELDIREFPCKPDFHPRLGEEVYIVGNPLLRGVSIRKANISRLSLYETSSTPAEKNAFFEVDKSLIPGDSGTPVINSDFELLGLSSNFNYDMGLGYVARIENFLPGLK